MYKIRWYDARYVNRLGIYYYSITVICRDAGLSRVTPVISKRMRRRPDYGFRFLSIASKKKQIYFTLKISRQTRIRSILQLKFTDKYRKPVNIA